MRIHNLVVEMVSIHSIQQHPENANNGDVDAIADSIQVNGYYAPIVVQASTRYVVVGNHRLLAAIMEGAQEIPAFVLELTDAEAKRMMVADNHIGRRSYDDEGQLLNLLEQLRATDNGLAGTGFEDADYQYLYELANSPLTEADFADDDGSDDPDSGIAEKRLNFSIMPVVSEDGRCYELTLQRAGLGAITANDLNMLRKALGQAPHTAAQLATYGVPSWDR